MAGVNLGDDEDLVIENVTVRENRSKSGAILVTESQDASQVEAATEALAKGTEAFAAERMNHSIQQALAGRSVESL